MEKTPLVAVTVLTYKSSPYIIDTLESIKAQTYKNIELIIADDCSPDNTVQTCQDWLEINKDRFVRTQIIVPDHNTGVSANCNRADDACTAEWIKELAGDDQLTPDSISTYVEYITQHPDVVYMFGRVECFTDDGTLTDRANWFDYDFFKLTREEQYSRLLKRNCIPAATGFHNVKRMNELGIRNDERIPMLEDHPKWLNCLSKGVQFHFVDKITARYRISENSLSTTSVLNLRLHESQRRFYYYYYFAKEYETDPENAIENQIRKEIESFDYYLMQERQRYENAINSMSFRLGHALLHPIAWIKSILK